MTSYGGYLIEPFESSPGIWRVRVRRQSGQSIETIAGEFASMVRGIDSKTANDPIAVAKGILDGLRRQSAQGAPTRQ